MPSTDTPASRLATRLSFFVAGFGMSCWAPLVPFAKSRLEVNDGVLGLLLLCIGGVLTAELFNSAVETLFRGLDETAKGRCWPALDIAAGAVLAASIVAAVIGGLIFVNRFSLMIWPE